MLVFAVMLMPPDISTLPIAPLASFALKQNTEQL